MAKTIKRPSMRKTLLLLVHVEEMFRDCITEEHICEMKRACHGADYVVHFTSHVQDDNPIREIADLVDQQITWSWGYSPGEYMFLNSQEEEHLICSLGHGYTWIPPELRDKRFWSRWDTVRLGGGADGSCLADMEAILDYLEVEHKREMEIIYCC